MMKRSHLLSLLTGLWLIGLLVSSCSREEHQEPWREPIPEKADQTIMIYLTGTDLSSYYNANIRAAMSVIDRDRLHNSRLLVFLEPKRDQGAVLELFYSPQQERCVADTLQRWTQSGFSSMESGTVTRILSYMAQQAPANRYGLIIGSHGFGWVPEGVSTYNTTASAKHVDPKIAQLPAGPLPTRWVGDPGRRSETAELGAAIAGSGVHFDYLIFDACFMSSIEALYDLRGCADNILASPTEIMAPGFPYDRILPSLLTGQGAGYDLEAVCRTYCDYYAQEYTVPSACIAQTVCSKLESLAAIVKQIEQARTHDPDVTALQSYEGFRSHFFFDLGDYVHAICDDQTLLDQFDRCMEQAFPVQNRQHTPWFYSYYGGNGDATAPGPYPAYMNRITTYSGVSTSAPSERVAAEWPQTAWYRATH